MIVPTAPAVGKRSAPVDAAKTAAIFGTILIHASAMGALPGRPGAPTGCGPCSGAAYCGALCRCFSCAPARCCWIRKRTSPSAGSGRITFPASLRPSFSGRRPTVPGRYSSPGCAPGWWRRRACGCGGRICSSGVTRPISITCTSSCWCTPCCPSPGSLPPGRTGN